LSISTPSTYIHVSPDAMVLAGGMWSC